NSCFHLVAHPPGSMLERARDIAGKAPARSRLRASGRESRPTAVRVNREDPAGCPHTSQWTEPDAADPRIVRSPARPTRSLYIEWQKPRSAFSTTSHLIRSREEEQQESRYR